MVGMAFFLSTRSPFAASAISHEDAGQSAGATRAEPSVGFTVLAGLSWPVCSGQPESCTGALGPGPSLRGLLLYQPNRSWGVGIIGQGARLHWEASYIGQVDGKVYGVQSDLTTGFVGAAARFTPFPDVVVTPIFELALGPAFQSESGTNFGCNDGLVPTGQLSIGASTRPASSTTIVAVASASGGLKGGCGVSDGPPATPFTAWQYGLHVGVGFDVGLSGSTKAARASSPSGLAHL